MARYEYRALNAGVAKAPANRLKTLLDSVPERREVISSRSKAISKLSPKQCNRRTHINDGYKMAMVQMRFGSLTDTTVIR